MVNHNPNLHSYLGAFAKGTIGEQPISGISSGAVWAEGWGHVTEYFDASRSSSIYGNSSTVQPPAIKVRVYARYQ